MIELEHDDVGLAAVDARVGREIFDDAATILGSGGGYVPQQARLLGVPIPPVVVAPILSKAFPTPRLEHRLASSHRRKGLEWL
ncbi:MAG TPA: hypothetical protein VF965_09205 [Candidatus Limnocylindria bacterium]